MTDYSNSTDCSFTGAEFEVLSLEYDTNWICVVLLCIGNTVVVVATLSFVNDNVFRARAIDVIAGWLAGLSMVPSGAMDREPRLELSLPVLCLEFNEGV